MKPIRKAISNAIDWFAFSILGRISSFIYPEYEAEFLEEFSADYDGVAAFGEGYGDPLEDYDDSDLISY